VNGTDGNRRQFRLQSVILCLTGLAGGAIPGALIADFVSRRTGIAVMFLGMPIGLVVALGFAAPRRLVRLLLAVLVARNIPTLHNSALAWVDDGSEPGQKSEAASERLLAWLLPEGAHQPRGYWVLGALITGIVAGGALMARDVAALNVGKPGFILPLTGARDSLVTQAVLVTICFGIWSAGAMGTLASVLYRRPILLAAAIAAYLSACLGYAGDDSGGERILSVVVGFTTAGVAFALIVAAVVASVQNPSDAPATTCASEDAEDRD
jgi:ABC-type amino acid transport system permease subunit